MLVIIFSKKGFFCPSKQKWFVEPFKTIPENRPDGQLMMEQLNYEWSQSFHIEFEFNWTKTTGVWESIFHVTGKGFQNELSRIAKLYVF